MHIGQTVTALESRGISISWQAPEDARNIAGYFIYHSESESGPWVQMNRYMITGFSYRTKELKAGHVHYFKIRTVDNDGNWSETVPIEQDL